MKPVIGIVGRSTLPTDDPRIYMTEYYRNTVLEVGGNPMMILPTQKVHYNVTKMYDSVPMTKEEKDMLLGWLKLCDGIVMPGGTKMFEHDFFILEYAIENDIPILGTCLGMQVMSHLKRKVNNIKNDEAGINHDQNISYVHNVTIDKSSKLYEILGVETFPVNSYHSFHVEDSLMYKTVGHSEDGLVEAIELLDKTFNIGVQWHPEKMIHYDENAKKLWEYFIKCSIEYHDKKIHISEISIIK